MTAERVPTDPDQLADFLSVQPAASLVVIDGAVTATNQEAIEVLGIPSARLIGAPFVELFVPELAEPVAAALADTLPLLRAFRVRLNRGFIPVEVTVRSLDGHTALVSVRDLTFEHELSAAGNGSLTHDPITSLPNRYHLLERLNSHLTAPNTQPVALLGLWIDDLATLEADRGPRVAQRVIRQVGERIHGRLRGPDLLGRYGDDAFLVVMASGMDADELTTVADRLRNEIAFPVEVEGGLVSFTASVAVGALGRQRPSLERILARLAAASDRASAANTNRTEILSF